LVEAKESVGPSTKGGTDRVQVGALCDLARWESLRRKSTRIKKKKGSLVSKGDVQVDPILHFKILTGARWEPSKSRNIDQDDYAFTRFLEPHW